jgi:NADH-quinone oxidoreductase subunit L
VEAQHNALLLLIPLFPLIGATINAFFGKRIQDSVGKVGVHGIAIAMPAISCVISWLLFFQLMGIAEPEQRAFVQVGWDWMHVGFADARFAFWLDPLSSMMTLIITTIGTMIHVYSIGYMHEEPAYWRFFCYLNLFVTMMLILVLGDNFLVMFIGWEGVGLASYLLIGFWYKELNNAAAGMKAFVVNRFGDACFVIGLFTLFWGMQGSWTTPVGGPAGGRLEAKAPFYAPLKPDFQYDSGVKALEDAVGPRPSTELAEKPQATLTFSRLRNVFDDEVAREKIRLERAGARDALAATRAEEALKTAQRAEFEKETRRLLVEHDGETEATLAAFDQKRGRGPITTRTIWGIPLLFFVCVAFFLGATAKSAQIPFYVWLPDAMAGPTPVSALIHAATMVTAGVYMIARLNYLFVLSPEACTVVGLIGAMTALFAASMGLFQYDIKKVLAYSTVSQLGFMFIGVGVGAYWAGVFHLLTHACFKACLFLGSGSVILGCHHEQDMRRMGGLAKYMPSTRWTYALACFAIAGFPLAAGFCSKDEILWKAFSSSAVHGLVPYANYAIWAMGIVAATLTSFYMYRSYYMTFSGEYRGNDTPIPDPYPADTQRAKELLEPKPVKGPSAELIASLAEHGHGAHGDHGDHGHGDHGHDDHHHDHHGGTPHESPSSMTGPLWVLGVASIILGVIVGFPPVVSSLLGLDVHPALEHWLEPVLAPGMTMTALYEQYTPAAAWLSDTHTVHLFEYALAALSIVVATLGWLTARWLYKDNANPLPERLMANPREAIKDIPILGALLPAAAGDGLGAAHRVIYNKYFVDEAYFTVMVHGMSKVWNGLKDFDVWVVDGLVKTVAFVGKYMGFIQGAIDKYVVDGAVNLVADIVMDAGQRLRKLQTGQIRTYLIGAFGGAVAAYMLVIALL